MLRDISTSDQAASPFHLIFPQGKRAWRQNPPRPPAQDATSREAEKMERARAALARANARPPAAERSGPSSARKPRPSATGGEPGARERPAQGPTEGVAPKRDEIPRARTGEAAGEQGKSSMLDRVRSWRSGEERGKERERKRLERGRRSHEKLEMWERRWLEEHPGYVSDGDYDGDESREGDSDGDGDGDGWVGGRGMWEGF